MRTTDPRHATLDGWIAGEAIRFSVDPSGSFNAAVDQVIASLDGSVELLGFGEALHGGEELLALRNRLFERLVEAHGYSAIVLESSLPAARLVNDYIAGRGPASYEEVQERGIGHGFGRLAANRELVEWMRRYNEGPSHPVKLRFYGCDLPDAPTGYASPRHVLTLVLDSLSSIDSARAEEQRQRIERLIGADSRWENAAIYVDPTQAIGLSPDATALRLETEDLLTELRMRRPELIARSDRDRYLEALQLAEVARQLLKAHAWQARQAGQAALLGMRDASIADNLAYIVARERGRGKTLVFAHNGHLQRGKFEIPVGTEVPAWWPAGAHLAEMLGPGYAVIGSALGVSDENGIGRPEDGTLEARLTASPGPARFIPTHRGEGLPAAEIAALPARSRSPKNPSYAPLAPQSFTDFDWLAVLDSATYNRGGRPLPG